LEANGQQGQLLLGDGGCVVGSVVTLPSPRSKAFASLPLSAQQAYRTASKIQAKLRRTIKRFDSYSPLCAAVCEPLQRDLLLIVACAERALATA
jgi:hypothetical protein